MPAPARGAAVIQRGTITSGGTVEATVTIAGDTWTLPTIAPVTTGQDVTVLWAGRQGVILAGGGGAPVAGINLPFDETDGLNAYNVADPSSDPMQFSEGIQWLQSPLAGDGGTAVKLAAGVSGTLVSELALDGVISLDVWASGAQNSSDTDTVVVRAGPIRIGSNSGAWYLAIGSFGIVSAPYTASTVHVIASYDTASGAWTVSFNGSTQAGTTSPTGPVDPVLVEVVGADNETTFDNLVVTGDLA